MTTAPGLTNAPSAPKAAAESCTKPDNLNGITPVLCKPERKVTYILHTSTSTNLSMPYAWAVNGVVGAQFAKKPLRCSGANGKISLTVQAGDTVTLFLNSDAHPSYRKNPVYAVTPQDRDVVVKVQEKKGKHADSDTPVLNKKPAPPATDALAASAPPSASKPGLKAAPPPPEVDEYTAPLTGDIWLKVSHKYEKDEVPALLPQGTGKEVAEAVASIYAGLNSAKLKISVPATATTAAKTLEVEFKDASNPHENITSFNLLSDGLPRVHPAGFAALFTSALESDVSRAVVTSNWRPSLGSIAHRAGLGIDVASIDKINFDRQELRTATSNKNDDDNVSAEEHRLYGKYMESEKAAQQAEAQRRLAAHEADAATAAVAKAEAKLAAAKTPEAKATAATELAAREEAQAAAERELAAARDRAAQKNATLGKDRKAWESEKVAREPAKVTAFRNHLIKCSCVRELFDPWYMDSNVQDKVAPIHNEQRGATVTSTNERLHSHHLHITVAEPKIL